MKNLVPLFRNTKSRFAALLTALTLALLPMIASAQTADFDPSTVTSKIVEYTGYGILMLAAFILGRWTLKALGVIGGK